jgi:fucose 4-O-acetylase-like acetyltransferase
MFHRNKGFWKKALAFIGIYILYELCIFWLKLIFGKEAELDMFHENAAPWFMLALAFYCVIGFLLHKILEKKKVALVLIAALVVFSCCAGYIESLGSFLALSRTVVFLPYYLLGMITDRKKLEKLTEKTGLRICGAAVLTVWLVICFVFMETVYKARPFLLAMEAYPEDVPFAFVWRLMFYVSGPLFGFFMIMITPVREIRPITLWGSRTLQVFFWHRHVLYAMKYAGIDKWFYKTVWGQAAWVLLAAVIVCVLSLKIFMFPTEIFIKLTRKK